MAQPPEDDAGVEALDLMKSLVGLLDAKWVTSARFAEIADHLDIQDLRARIALIAGLKALASHLPAGVFTDSDARDRLLKAAQEALDLAIEDEESQG